MPMPDLIQKPTFMRQARDLQSSICLIEENVMTDSGTLTVACSRLNEYLQFMMDQECCGNDMAMDMAKIVSSLIMMMKSRPHDVDLQVQTVSAMCTLSEMGAVFAKEDEIKALLTVMRAHTDNVHLQIAAGFMLGILGEEILTLQRRTIQEVATTATVVMEACMQEHEVLLYGMRVLFILSRELDDVTVHRTMRVLVTAMRTHAQEAHVQATGCTLLNGLVHLNDRNDTHMWAEGVMSALLAGMKVGIMCRQNVKLCCLIHTESPVTVEQKLSSYCKAIQRMYTSSTQLPQQPREEHGLSVLTRTIGMDMETTSTVIDACNAITCAANAVHKNREILGRHALNALMLVVDTYKSNAEVQTAAFLTLRALANSVEHHCVYLADRETLQQLLQQTELHRSDCNTRSAACTLFYSMSKCGGIHAVDAMLAAGVVACVTKMMVLSHAHDTDQNQQTLRYGCGALGCITAMKCAVFRQQDSSSAHAHADLFAFRRCMIQERVADTVIRAMLVLGTSNLSKSRAHGHSHSHGHSHGHGHGHGGFHAHALARAHAHAHTDDEGIQWYGVHAIHSLLSGSKIDIQDVGFRTIRPVILVMLSSFSACAEVRFDQEQWFGVDVLQIVLHHCKVDCKHKHQREFALCGGFKASVQCLRMIDKFHGTHTSRQSAADMGVTEADLLLKTLTVMCLALINNSDNQRKCGDEAHMLDIILHIISTHQKIVGGADVCELACTILDMITHKNDNITRILLSKGALKVVSSAQLGVNKGANSSKSTDRTNSHKSTDTTNSHESTDRLLNRLQQADVKHSARLVSSCLTMFRGVCGPVHISDGLDRKSDLGEHVTGGQAAEKSVVPVARMDIDM
jgi:hypothetical protein